MRPKFYHNDRFRLGTLSGSTNSPTNPMARACDGDVGLYYVLTSGSPPFGRLEVELPTTEIPYALVISKAAQLSGCQILLESTTLARATWATRVNELASGAVSEVFVVSGDSGLARHVWRLTVSGVTVSGQLQLYEAMLADLQEMPRSNEVGVERTRVRQYTRIPIPGGAPFVKRDGPRLRRTGYSFTVLDGAEVQALEAFVDSVDGGEFFFHVDDRGEQYVAELANPGQVFTDTAGVYSISMVVQEVETD